jgi:hypothetical protein
MGRKYGFSFSLNRALGISSFKRSIARATGIPTTRFGLYRKLGRALTGGMFSTSSGRQHKSGRNTFGVSFSLNRALGISGAKNSLARAIGIPTTASGLERKLGKMLVDGVGGVATTVHPQRSSSAIPTPQALSPVVGISPMPVDTGILCALCGLALYADEIVCPRCAAPAPGIDAPTELRLTWIDLDALRPIEQEIVNLLGEHFTDAQLAQRLRDAGAQIEEHPLLALVRHWGHYTCTHATHATQDTQENCLNRQASKVALHTLRHQLATLVGLASFAHPATLRFAVWLCDDASDNCPLCRQREGIVIPVTIRRLPILDPFCDCNLHVMPPGGEDIFLASVARTYLAQSPDRAQTLRRNAFRSGFLRKQPASASAGGCGMALLMIILTMILAGLFLR